MSSVIIWIVIVLFIMLAIFFFILPGYSFSGIMCAGIAGVILCYFLLGLLGRSHVMAAKVLKTVLSSVICIGVVAAALTFAVIHKAAQGDANAQEEYLVVLGAGVRGTTPSTILGDRIGAAADYLNENPDVICIVSGGQGPGEDISEAQCMYDRLTAAGIDPERIWMEDQSTSTRENLQFSLDLIEMKTGSRPDALRVLSSEFHLYRAAMVAEKCGISISGVPAKTSHVTLWVNYMMREIVAVWYYTVLGGY